MDDVRSEQRATAVSPVLADSVWAAAWGSTLSQPLSWIQWAALDFAQFGLSLTLTQENTESLELLRILWIPPEFFLGHFSIRLLSEPCPCYSLCIRGVDGACSPLNACWQGLTPPTPALQGGGHIACYCLCLILKLAFSNWLYTWDCKNSSKSEFLASCAAFKWKTILCTRVT